MDRGRPRDFDSDFEQSHREHQHAYNNARDSNISLWIGVVVTIFVVFICTFCLCFFCPFCIWATRRRNNRQIGYGGQAVIGVGVPQQPSYGQWLQQGAYQAPGGYGYGQQLAQAYGQQQAPGYGQQQVPGYESAPSGSGPQVEQAPQTA